MDQLRERIAKYVLPMFFHKKEGQKENLPTLQTALVPGHKGDAANTGLAQLYVLDQGRIQMLFYERVIKDTTYIYGYFAYVRQGAEKGSKLLADDKGMGVKYFDEFWKTLTP